jgi:endonuclease-8
MAEGDTILRLSRRLEQTLGGKTITASAPNLRGRAAGVEQLDGRRLDGVKARGKHLLLEFGDIALHSHLGMSGAWHMYRRGERWWRARSAAWAVLGADGVEAVEFGGPTLRVVRADRLRRDPQISRLGPDLLAEEFDALSVVAAMRADPTRRLGDALLDQSLVAGIGNIFKSEACFAARIDPWRPTGDLSDEDLHDVLLVARALMLDAVASGRHPAEIYRRRGPCRVCGGPISVRGQGDANRTTYWCSRCQR